MVSYNEDDEVFQLASENGFCMDSTITETEDVSYVSSPYLPFTCRDLRRSDGVQRAPRAESGLGASSVRDELDVQITSAGW